MLPTNGFGNRKRGGWLGIDPLETARSRVERPDVGRDCGRLAEKHSGYPVRRPHLAELAEAFPYSEKPVATPGRNEHRVRDTMSEFLENLESNRLEALDAERIGA